MYILEDNIVSEVRREAYSVMTKVETGVQDAILTTIQSSMIPRVELSMKSANASSGRSVDGTVLEPDHRYFSRKIEGFQMTAASKINSHIDLKTVEETRGNITAEGGYLLVNEKRFDRQAHTHHISFFKLLFRLFIKWFLIILDVHSSLIPVIWKKNPSAQGRSSTLKVSFS